MRLLIGLVVVVVDRMGRGTITNSGMSFVGHNNLNYMYLPRTVSVMVVRDLLMSRGVQVNVGLSLAKITFYYYL